MLQVFICIALFTTDVTEQLYGTRSETLMSLPELEEGPSGRTGTRGGTHPPVVDAESEKQSLTGETTEALPVQTTLSEQIGHLRVRE